MALVFVSCFSTLLSREVESTTSGQMVMPIHHYTEQAALTDSKTVGLYSGGVHFEFSAWSQQY